MCEGDSIDAYIRIGLRSANSRVLVSKSTPKTMHDLTWLRSDLPLKKSVILSPKALANITITRNNIGLPEVFIARLQS